MNQVTSYELFARESDGTFGELCWNCKTGSYLVYKSDPTQTPRCGQCGELQQDNPAKKVPVKQAPAKGKTRTPVRKSNV